MNAQSVTASKRSLWPYAIAGYFAAVITGIVILLIRIVPHRTELVRDDYYEHEILFQQQIDAMNRARPFARELAAAYDPGQRAVQLRLPAAHLAGQFSGTAHFYRPSDARLDRDIELKPDHEGRQTINGVNLMPGLWKVRLDWISNGEAFASERTLIVGD